MPVAAGNKRLNLDELIQQRLLNDPFRQQAGDWFSKVLAPGYQAYTPEQMNQMYQARAQQMVEDVFKPQEERFAARLATSGLSGSGVAADLWANEVMKNQNRQLGDLWSQIEQENLALTRADQAQALSMFPALSSLGDVLTYRGILSEDEARRFQQEYQNRMYELQKEGQTFDQTMRQLMYELQKEGQLFDQDYRTQLLVLQRLAQEFERQMASEQFKYQKKKDTATGLGKLLGGIAGLIFGGPGGAAAGGGIGGLLDKIFS